MVSLRSASAKQRQVARGSIGIQVVALARPTGKIRALCHLGFMRIDSAVERISASFKVLSTWIRFAALPKKVVKRAGSATTSRGQPLREDCLKNIPLVFGSLKLARSAEDPGHTEGRRRPTG